MALWFVSGVVMMYVGYPKLTALERLAHLPPLVIPDACCVTAQQALTAARGGMPQASMADGGQGARLDRHGSVPDIRLAMVGGAPYWLVNEAGHGQAAVQAITGKPVARFDAAHALDVAARFAPGSTPRLVETVRQDIFTVSRALHPHRPLHLVALDDAQGTELYVSSRTGEVVRDSTRVERGWNYAGSIIHWLYPLKGEWLDPWRPHIIIYLSLAGTVLAILGIWVGLLRWRFSGRFSSGSRSPYRGGWMRWHHLSGLVFGLITLTWILSGLMSMNPWKIFEFQGQRPDPRLLAGGAIETAPWLLAPAQAIARADFTVREAQLRVFNGRPYYILYAGDGATRAIAADTPAAEPFHTFPEAELAAAAGRLMPNHRVVRMERLDRYDNYYHARRPHTMTGHVERRLPMLRVTYDDPGRTWVHLDPHTAAIHSRIDQLGRVKRWLFAFLHSWDLPVFIDSRPLWDVVLIVLSSGGFVLCSSAVVLGWRRLRHGGRNGRTPPVRGALPEPRQPQAR